MIPLALLPASLSTDVSVLSHLFTYALAGIPIGLLSGLLLGMVANKSDGMGGYGSLRRRAMRLGHIAAVMLPLIAGFYALAASALDASAPLLAWAVPLWIAAAWGLVLVLFATGWRPRLRYLLPLPASGLTTAAVLFALALFPVAP
jgi:hypothetical protein